MDCRTINEPWKEFSLKRETTCSKVHNNVIKYGVIINTIRIKDKTRNNGTTIKNCSNNKTVKKLEKIDTD